MNTFRTFLTSRTLCAAWALWLLAAPTMALCLECVSGVCDEQSLARQSLASATAHERHLTSETLTESGVEPVRVFEVSGDEMPAGHCDRAKDAKDVEPNGQPAEARMSPSVDGPVVAGDCCGARTVLETGEVATRTVGSEFAGDVLVVADAFVSTPSAPHVRVLDRSGGDVSPPPLYRLHAALLL